MKKLISVILLIFILVQGVNAYTDVDSVMEDVGACLLQTEPSVGSICGEWTILGLARSNVTVPNEFFDKYYEKAEQYVRERNGVLHRKKYTEYSRLILALTAIRKDPTDVAGYNLLEPLGDFDKTVWQGVNGAIWALIALDSGDYAIPQNPDAKVQATREMYVNFILSRQLSDGGWAMSGDTSDCDVTAMALCALSKYKDGNVEGSVKCAIECLSEMQDETGGYSSAGAENAESCAQVVTALSQLGIAIDDSRFVKNGHSVLDKLITYYVPEKGFKHCENDGDVNRMATEQAFYALCAYKRASSGLSGLYTMTDYSDKIIYNKVDIAKYLSGRLFRIGGK